MNCIKVLLIKIVFLSSSWVWACDIGKATENKELESCFHSELYDWKAWSSERPGFADIIPPVGRFHQARLFYFRSAYRLGFPVSDLSLENKMNLATIKILDPESLHEALEIDMGQINDQDSGDLLKSVSNLSITTTLKQPEVVQKGINLLFDSLIALEQLAEDQPKELFFDGHYYFVKDRNEIKEWMPLLSEIDPLLTTLEPTQMLVQYMDNFSFLAVRGLSVTLFFERDGKTNVLQYMTVSLKGNLLKAGIDDFLMGKNTPMSLIIRKTRFDGLSLGVIGGLPNYFKQKVESMREGMIELNNNPK